MSARKFISSYLSFGKRDRIGIISLGVLILIIYFLPFLFAKKELGYLKLPLSIASDTLEARSAQAGKLHGEKQKFLTYQKPFPNNTGSLFQFDPNTLSAQGWEKLGLKDKTIQTIEKYRGKGGRFYKTEDLEKIWGLPKGFYARVKDYISIVATEKKFTKEYTASVNEKKEKKNIVVNINETDTSALISLPGIGSKLAARIINFREKLGGFYSVDQVGETYGVPDSVFQKIRAYLHVEGSVKKFNLNTVTKDELKNHPYFRWSLANAIVAYRNQHGDFKSLEELKNIAAIEEGVFKKIVQYLFIE